MPKEFTQSEQVGVLDAINAIRAASQMLSRNTNAIEEHDPTFAFDYWEAACTQREWDNHNYVFVDRDGTNFRSDVILTHEWKSDHVTIVGTGWDGEDHINFDIPYTWFTDRATHLAQFAERDAKEAEDKRKKDAEEKERRITNLELELKRLKS